MSAVIAFPSNARHFAERLQAVRDTIRKRAQDRGATQQQRDNALALAIRMMDRGESAGYALAKATELLPSVRVPTIRPWLGGDAA